MYRLLNRHLREIQYNDPLQRFEVLGIQVNKNLSEEDFSLVFENMELEDIEIKKIMASYIGSKMAI